MKKLIEAASAAALTMSADDKLAVTQEAREAAAAYYLERHDDVVFAEMVRAGKADNSMVVQAFARFEAQARLAGERIDKWQPIETCPEDGTVVLFYTPGPDPKFHMSRSDDRWSGAYWLAEATHWQPLPDAPETTQGGSNG